MKTKYIWLTSIFLLSAIGLRAQNLVVTLTNATTETFAVSEIQSIKFGEATMILHELDGTVNTWDIEAIENYAFDGVANINETTTITTDDLRVFPNPSSDVVKVNFSSNRSCGINISVYDINGRKVEELYNGTHDVITEAVWDATVEPGQYFIKISAENKVITKPVVIQ